MPPEKEKDAESRFAYLLQPIRDLAKNWDVDVASQLEDYISEVPQSTIRALCHCNMARATPTPTHTTHTHAVYTITRIRTCVSICGDLPYTCMYMY